MSKATQSGAVYREARRSLKAAVALTALGALGFGRQSPAQVVPTPAMNAARLSHRSWRAETAMKIEAPFRVAAIGDIIMPQPLYDSDPRFQQLIGHMRRSDVGFGNFEMSLVDFRTFRGPVAGTEAPFSAGKAVKAMGINIVSRANNHTFDGDTMGMVSTDRELDKLGIAHAGTGMDLQQARSAGYLETPKGRVGVVSLFSVCDAGHYGPEFAKSLATYRNGDIGGAPGADPLHLTCYHVVSPAHLALLKKIAASAYGPRPGSDVPARGGWGERFKFFDQWYEAGANPGDIHYEMDPKDLTGILQSIRDGKIYSDFMIVNIHDHQTTSYRTAGVGGISHAVPDFVVKLAHASVSDGADMFVVEGVHALRGIEIYEGKPIFYGLGSFVFQFGLQFGRGYDILNNEHRMSGLENPASQISVMPVSYFDHGKLVKIMLYPADLGGAHRPISRMGIPLTPPPAEAERILTDLQEYSKPFGTNIVIENGVGVITIAPDGGEAS